MKRLTALSFLILMLVLSRTTGVHGQLAHSVTVNIMDGNNPSGTGYAVYRLTGACPNPNPSTAPPAGFTLLNSTAITTLTYVDSTVTAGQTYAYVVDAVNSSGSAAPSNCAQGTIPALFPVSISINVK